MKKFYVTTMVMAALSMGITVTALAATALVPQDTTMGAISGPGNSTVSVGGSVRIKNLDVYHNDGRNNTSYSPSQMGGDNASGPYSLVLESSKKQTAPYGLNGDTFNFEHYVMETDDAGKICEVVRWSHIDGAECFGGCPAYMGFNPQTKEGIISVPEFWRGKHVAVYTVYKNLTPAAQQAFMDMYNGKSVMPDIEVR